MRVAKIPPLKFLCNVVHSEFADGGKEEVEKKGNRGTDSGR